MNYYSHVKMLWFILFSIVLLYNIIREKQYLFIFYTQWTFTMETIYFGLRTFNRDTLADKIWPYLFAPAAVVCIGFWTVIAPIHLFAPDRGHHNLFMLSVTHGCNFIAVLYEQRPILSKDIYKPVLYTTVYNFFLAIYVGAGGRTISGQLPYWYTQYDSPIGWAFAALTIAAVAIVHFMVGKTPHVISKQYIV